MSWWVGAYIEAGMGTGSSGTAYLPFVFQDATKAQAQKDAAAKLLAGPFDTQGQAQNWATAYERNPNTLHVGTTLPQGPGQPVKGGGTGPGGTGTSKGDKPPNPAAGLLSGWHLVLGGFGGLGGRLLKVAFGGILIIAGVMRLTGAKQTILQVAKGAVPV
jgi:hypothetical protein